MLLKTFYSGLKETHSPLDVSKGHAALAANTTLRHAVNVTAMAANGCTKWAISCPAIVTRIMGVMPREVSSVMLTPLAAVPDRTSHAQRLSAKYGSPSRIFALLSIMLRMKAGRLYVCCCM